MIESIIFIILIILTGIISFYIGKRNSNNKDCLIIRNTKIEAWRSITNNDYIYLNQTDLKTGKTNGIWLRNCKFYEMPWEKGK